MGKSDSNVKPQNSKNSDSKGENANEKMQGKVARVIRPRDRSRPS